MIVSFQDIKIQSSQKYSAYASYIRHYGGQIYDSNSFPFYTHQFLSTSEQFQSLREEEEQRKKEEQEQEYRPTLKNLLLKLYSYFLSSLYLRSSSSNSTPASIARPITYFPISISGLWIESSLHISSYYLSSSSFIHYSIRSSTSYTISSIISSIIKSFTTSNYIISLQDNNQNNNQENKSIIPTSLPWDYSLSDCSYLPLLQSIQSSSKSKSNKKTIFNKKCRFLVSSLYSNIMKQNIIDVIRYIFIFHTFYFLFIVHILIIFVDILEEKYYLQLLRLNQSQDHKIVFILFQDLVYVLYFILSLNINNQHLNNLLELFIGFHIFIYIQIYFIHESFHFNKLINIYLLLSINNMNYRILFKLHKKISIIIGEFYIPLIMNKILQVKLII